MAKYETHKFYCLACGEEGLPIQRKLSRQKERFHRKKLFCPHCHNTVNHIECKTMEDIEIFKEEFAKGVYKNEAEGSLAISGNTWLW